MARFTKQVLFLLLLFTSTACNTDPYVDDGDKRANLLGFRIDDAKYIQDIDYSLLLVRDYHAWAGLNPTKDSLVIKAEMITVQHVPYDYNIGDLFLKIPLMDIPFGLPAGEFKPDGDCIITFAASESGQRKAYYSVPRSVSFAYTFLGENRVKGTFSMTTPLINRDATSSALVQIEDGVFNLQIQEDYYASFKQSLHRSKNSKSFFPGTEPE